MAVCFPWALHGIPVHGSLGGENCIITSPDMCFVISLASSDFNRCTGTAFDSIKTVIETAWGCP